MSIESKIKQMLTEKSQAAATLPMGNPDNGDKTQPKQGNSEDNPAQELSTDAPGKDASAAAKQTPPIATVSDAKTAKVQSMEGVEVEIDLVPLEEAFSRKHFEATAELLRSISDHGMRMNMGQKHIDMFKKDNPRFDEAKFKKAAEMHDVAPKNESVNLKSDIAALFEGQENLAEGFVDKATALFDAAVIARANAEVITITEALEEKSNAELVELKTALTEQADAYLTEMVQVWIAENKLAIDAGLKNEISESFMNGLKDLFTEHYIEVPENKVDVLESLTKELETSTARINEEVNSKLAIQKELTDLKKLNVLSEASKGMTATDADRLSALVEGVEFDTIELYTDKVAVIKEQHFKKTVKKSAETILAESETGDTNEVVIDANVQKYVSAYKRTNPSSPFTD
jgi:hypothetical protein